MPQHDVRRTMLAIAVAAVACACRATGTPEDIEIASVADANADESGGLRTDRFPSGRRAAAPKGTVTIRVVNAEDGHALGGVRVRLMPPTWKSEILISGVMWEPRSPPRPEETHATDATGTVVVSGESYDELDCVAEADGYVAAGPDERHGTPKDVVTVRLRHAAGVEGHVVDAATGAPVAGARVTARKICDMYDGIRRMECGTATTDRDGSFRLTTLVPDGHVWLQVAADGMGTGIADIRTGPAKQIAPGVDVRVAAAADLVGIVRGRDGRPAADAKVVVTAGTVEYVEWFARLLPFPFRWTIDELAETKTAVDGSFRVAGLAAGARFTVYAIAEEPASYAVAALTAGAPPQDLVTTRFPRVSVRLLGEDGVPVAKDRQVFAYLDSHGRYASSVGDDGWTEVAPELDGVGLGRHRITLQVQGLGTATLDVDTKPGEDLRLEATPRR